MRVRTPWIQALRESQKEVGTVSEKPVKLASRDLKAKRMADSFHRVVSGKFRAANCEYTSLTDSGLGDPTCPRSMAL